MNTASKIWQSFETEISVVMVVEIRPDAGFGVRWDSFGYDWPVSRPIVSARDAAFAPLSDLLSSARP